jgi:hypothetical protein
MLDFVQVSRRLTPQRTTSPPRHDMDWSTMNCAEPKLSKIMLGVLSILDMEQVWFVIFAQRQRRLGLRPHSTFGGPISIYRIATGKPNPVKTEKSSPRPIQITGSRGQLSQQRPCVDRTKSHNLCLRRPVPHRQDNTRYNPRWAETLAPARTAIPEPQPPQSRA